MDRTRRALVAAAALLLTSCAGHPLALALPNSPHVELSAVPTALNVNWDMGLPVVEVYVDGHGPLKFLLDSGAAFYAIDRRAADELKLERVDLPSDGEGAGISAGGGETYVPYAVRIHEIRTGPLIERDTGAAVFDLSLLEQASGTRIDGVLPAGAFRDVLLTLDFVGKTATVEAGELPPADDKDVLALKRWGGVACVDVDFGGNSYPFIVDTGGKTPLVVPDRFESSLNFREKPVVVGEHASLAGRTPISAGRLNGSIALGRHKIVSPVVELSSGSNAIVGVDVLREFRVTFDFSHSRIRFERSDDKGPIRSRSERSLGIGLLRKDGSWTVEYVLDDSPAARCGVQVGDCIESIDGRPTDGFSVSQRNEMLHERQSLRLRVVAADGTTRDVVVPVVTLVE